MSVKAHYRKIYLTDRGPWGPRRGQQQLDSVLENFPPLALDAAPLTAQEKRQAALALAAALPERLYSGAYQNLLDAASV